MIARLVLPAVLAGAVAGAGIALLQDDRGGGGPAAGGAALVAADVPGRPRPAPAGDPRRPRVAPPVELRRGGGLVELRRDGPVTIEVRRRDPAGGPDWAVRTFDARRVVPPDSRRRGVDPVIGRNRCAQLGRIHEGRFGWVDARNTFRPARIAFRGGAPTWCGSRRPDLGGEPHFEVVTRITDPAAGAAAPLQTVAWGVVGPAGRAEVLVRGRRAAVTPTASGAVLVVAPGAVRRGDVEATVRYPGRSPVELAAGDWRSAARERAARFERLPGWSGRRMTLPAAGARPRVEARTPDPHGGLAWGVAAVRSARGGWCLSETGRIVGDRVGRVDHELGLFHEAGPDVNDSCGTVAPEVWRRSPVTLSSSSGGGVAGDPGEDPLAGRVERRTQRGLTLFTGRARPDVVRLTIATPRDVRTILPSRRARAFVLAYDGTFPTGEIVITARTRTGRIDRTVLPNVGP